MFLPQVRTPVTSFLPPCVYICTSPPDHPSTLQAPFFCAPQNCSPRSALTWEDWLQAAACSSREQARRRALGGNNLTPDPPLPQHELRTGFGKREERNDVNLWRKVNRQELEQVGQQRGRRKRGGLLKHKVGWCTLLPLLFFISEKIFIFTPANVMQS